MTYDLSDALSLSDGYEGMPALECSHSHPWLLEESSASLARSRASQSVISSMGDFDFLDFRIMYTAAPHHVGSAKDWYWHGCETNCKAFEYLKEVRTWLDAHPSEIVVIWA